MLLGFDTATTTCSAALWATGEVRACRQVALPGKHAEALVPMLREVAAEAGTTLDAMEAFAVTVGPGSFTGIRIGLATARGLALARGRPLVGLTTLEVLAAGVPEHEREGPILVALDAGRGRLYAQVFDRTLRPLCDARALAADALPGILAKPLQAGPFTVVGTGRKAALAALPPGCETTGVSASPSPDARVLVRLAAGRAGAGAVDAGTVRPLYLREAVVRPGGSEAPRG